MSLKVVTGKQMAEIDRVSIEERGIPSLHLMEMAGEAVASILLGEHHPGHVAIVCGKGNNAGDGYVAARYLAKSDVKVDVISLCPPEDLSGDALANYEKLREINLAPIFAANAASLIKSLNKCEWIIDAILGTGLKGAARGFLGEAIDILNSTGKPILACDIPSGLPGDGSAPEGPVIKAAETVTMGLPKVGMLQAPGVDLTGYVTIAPLDFPPDLLTSDEIKINVLEENDMRNWLPSRKPDGHKGTFGKVMLIAGSFGMTGAAVLCSRSAARSGVGLVYLALPERLAKILAPQIIETVSIPVPPSDFPFFNEHSLFVIQERLSEIDAAGLGPGLGSDEGTRKFVRDILSRAKVPIVLDADGLNALAGHTELFTDVKAPLILTPHPGEMSRLTGLPIIEITANRIEIAFEYSKKWGVVLLLKGNHSVIADPAGQCYINPTGNSGLAKGGSGDVLTGLIAGFLAQGMSPIKAACAGAFIHGLSADLAADNIPPRAMIPSDIIESLPLAFLQLNV